MILAAYASGYPRNYSTDEDELRACLGENRASGGRLATGDLSDPRMFWWPSTIDFWAEAERRGVPLGVANFQALVAAIRRYRNLTNVYWFGHGAARELHSVAPFSARSISLRSGAWISPLISVQARPSPSSHATPASRPT